MFVYIYHQRYTFQNVSIEEERERELGQNIKITNNKALFYSEYGDNHTEISLCFVLNGKIGLLTIGPACEKDES